MASELASQPSKDFRISRHATDRGNPSVHLELMTQIDNTSHQFRWSMQAELGWDFLLLDLPSPERSTEYHCSVLTQR